MTVTPIVRTFSTAVSGDPTKTTDTDYTKSVSATWDVARTCVVPPRSLGGTILSSPFEGGMGAWVATVNGTGVVDIVDPHDPDTQVGLALNLFSGSQVGSVVQAKRALSAVPDSFSFAALTSLKNIGTDPANAAIIQLQNNAGKNLLTRFYDGQSQLYIDGAYANLFARGSAQFMETWIDAVSLGNGQHTVSIRLGTELVNSLTGTLPDGPTANNNALIASLPNVTANRQFQIGAINVGPSQLPDAMIWVSPQTVLPSGPSVGHVEIWAGNVSNNMVPNGNIRAYISKDDGATWAQVTLTDTGTLGGPPLDPPKALRVLRGDANFNAGPGTQIRLNVETDYGCYFPLQMAAINVDYP